MSEDWWRWNCRNWKTLRGTGHRGAGDAAHATRTGGLGEHDADDGEENDRVNTGYEENESWLYLWTRWCLLSPHLERVFYIIVQAFVVRVGIGVGNGGRGFGRQPDKGDAYSLGEAAGATFERAFGSEEAGAASASPALSRF